MATVIPTMAHTATNEAITDPLTLIFRRVAPPIIRAMAIHATARMGPAMGMMASKLGPRQ